MSFIKINFFVLLIALFSFFPFDDGLYIDQVGKFDWRKRHIGCPRQTWFGHIDSQDTLLILSEENVIGRINVGNGEIVWRQINELSPKHEILSVGRSTITTKFGQKQCGFDLHTGALQWKKMKLNDTEDTAESHQLVEDKLLKTLFHYQNGDLEIQLLEMKQMMKLKLEKNDATIKELKVLGVEKEADYKIFIHWSDCRLDLYQYSQNDAMLKPLWARHESLATISDVFMVDLPLSESQARIESEFNLNEPILHSFLLRIHCQLEQIHRFFINMAERVVQTLDLIIRGEFSYKVLFNQFFADPNRVKEENDAILERDYFNMRKMIVVSTLAGTLHGLSSETGNVHWTVNLGKNVMSYRSGNIPLFLMRGTAFYQWDSHSAAVFNEKDSPNSIILIFNPITGERIDRLEIPGGLLRVERWNSATSEQLYPLMLVRNNAPTKVEFWPPVQPSFFQAGKSVYIMLADKNTGKLAGSEVNVRTNDDYSLIEQWRSSIPNSGKGQETIEIIRGKSIYEKVQSQGRVLGDRSVLYKYANPNLVAILSSNREDMSMSIHLIDVVSGQLIYSGIYSRAVPPFHLVHCENWIVVSYWSERAKRTEIGIIELFEGHRQTNSTHFNSFQATYEPIKVISQTYIFPQGISAMSPTRTAQGLTSRSVLIGLPFGGVLEMSRRLLDSRRPLEMTPELREEMLIPYIPELPLAIEDLINYNQTVGKLRGIKAAPSGLESSSLVFVYGLDLFFTRAMPSGTFDILKDDFDYAFIAAVMVLLMVAAYACKKISRYQSIQKAWE